VPAQVLVGSASDLDPGFLSDPYAAGQRVSGGLADWTVVTRGADGATAHGHESTLHEPARPVTPIDTMHGLANGLSMARCLALATAWGAAAVATDGSLPDDDFPPVDGV
jgi:sugar/nucleoside kinase (ribokinase family)